MIKKAMFIIGGGVLVFALQSKAEDIYDLPYIEGPYLSVKAIGIYPGETNWEAASSETTVEYDAGYGGGGSIGFKLPYNFRVEGEFSYLHSDVDSVGGVKNSNAVEVIAIMANLLYDIPLPNSVPVKPYVGAGIGSAFVEFEPAAGKTDDTPFAYQGIAGASIPVNANNDIFVSYRYLRTLEGNYDNAGVPFDAEFDTHIGEIGWRMMFNML